MAHNCPQKVLNEIWVNGVLFSHNRKLRFVSDDLSIKVLLHFKKKDKKYEDSVAKSFSVIR